MGQSTNAYVFYGYCWDDEDVEFEPDMSTTVEAILAERGHADPWDNYPNGDRATVDAWMRENKPAIDEYRGLKESVEEEIDVDWGTHCSDSCSIPYLFVRGTEVTAYRGYPKPLASMDVDPAWKPKLDAFLASQGVDAPEGENQPGWWTASYADSM